MKSDRLLPVRGQSGWSTQAVGLLTKGRYWEIIPVPDISGQAAVVAGDIAMELGR